MGYEDLIGEIQLVLLQVKNIAKDLLCTRDRTWDDGT